MYRYVTYLPGILACVMYKLLDLHCHDLSWNTEFNFEQSHTILTHNSFSFMRIKLNKITFCPKVLNNGFNVKLTVHLIYIIVYYALL